MRVHAIAPGRVNLIGDHTDYLGGLALPMAIDRATEVLGERGGDHVVLRSAELEGEVRLPVDAPLDTMLSLVGADHWGRYVAGVVAELRPTTGFEGALRSTVPVGSGLSSSAALEVAIALALGHDGTTRSLAELCQRAEQSASGVPCGIMDQLTSAAGIAGHALLMDFGHDTITPVPVPDDLDIVVVHSGESRTLAGSAYATRRAECERAESLIGPLRSAALADLDGLTDPLLRRRAHHVITENQRVRTFAEALRARRAVEAGRLMVESHASLRDDFEVSTPTLDALVARLAATPGVHGARLTGAGFGGCVVAVTEPGALDLGWRVLPSEGARLLDASQPSDQVAGGGGFAEPSS